MPKYYCDYCDIYLTHDAPRVRKDHNSGWKHIANVRNHFMERSAKLQIQLDEIYKMYEVKGEVPPPPVNPTIPDIYSVHQHVMRQGMQAQYTNTKQTNTLFIPQVIPGAGLPVPPPPLFILNNIKTHKGTTPSVCSSNNKHS